MDTNLLSKVNIDRNLLSKVNLNGRELVIADMNARNIANSASLSANTNASDINALTTRVTNLETNGLVTATYDAQSSTLSLTSKS